MNKQIGNWERRVARLIAFGILLYAVVLNLGSVLSGARSVLGAVTPIIVGCVIALVLDVPVHGFEALFSKLDRKGRLSAKLRSTVSLVLSAIVMPLVIFVLFKLVVPQFISAITNVINIVKANEDKIAAFMSRLGVDAGFVSQTIDDIINWITLNFSLLTGTAVNTVVSVFTSVTDMVLGVILAIYFLADKIAIKRRLRRLARAFLPDRACSNVLHVGAMFVSTFRTFLSRQFLESLILGMILLVCMLIFRIPYAITIACMTAILALIPYIGAFISCAIGAVLIVTLSPLKALIFVIIFLVAQQVEGNVIYPRVVGHSVGLPAYITLAAVVVGGAVAGVIGMFFIIPVVSVFYVLLRESVQRRNAEKDAAAVRLDK